MFDMAFHHRRNIGNHFCFLTFTCRDTRMFSNNDSNITYNFGAYHLINKIIPDQYRIDHNTPVQHHRFSFQIEPDLYSFDMMFIHYIFSRIYGIYGYQYNNGRDLHICTSSKYVEYIKNVINCLRDFQRWRSNISPELIELQKNFQRHIEHKVICYTNKLENNSLILGFKLEKKLTTNFTYCMSVWNDETRQFQFNTDVVNGRYHRKYKQFLNFLARLINTGLIENKITEVHINNSLMNIVLESSQPRIHYFESSEGERSFHVDQNIITHLLENIF